MLKKLFLLFFILIACSGCISVQEKIDEINERLKGDGTPYIPGI